ncbi:MAG: hypothetical protein KDD75_16830 [Caldilineaceae bacterium]|nr:hypothetical protein [Caldilineaceae bacterium]
MPDTIWGAYSVVDALETRALVADILLYDRLVIPCPPPDDVQYQAWLERGWKPKAQARTLRRITGLYEPVFWTEDVRQKFREFCAASGPGGEPKLVEVVDRARMELNSLQETRRYLLETQKFLLFSDPQHLPEGHDAVDIAVVAAFRSNAAFGREIPIDPAAKATKQRFHPDRRTNIYHMFARKLVVPATEDEDKALGMAVELAQNDSYQRHRRRFHEYVNQRLGSDGTQNADRRAAEDAIAEANEIAKRTFNGERNQIAVLCGKGLTSGVQLLKGDFTGLATGFLEWAGYAAQQDQVIPYTGPLAMLHDIMEKMQWSKLGAE